MTTNSHTIDSRLSKVRQSNFRLYANYSTHLKCFMLNFSRAKFNQSSDNFFSLTKFNVLLMDSL